MPYSPASANNTGDGFPRSSNIDPIFYLHVPGTGSGFATTIAHHACAGRIHENVSVLEPRDFLSEWNSVCDHSNFLRFHSGHEPLNDIVESEIEHVVMMVRKPSQRILSRYYSGLQDCWYLRRKHECKTSNVTDQTKCNGDIQTEHGFYLRDPATILPVEYGQCVENCTANMLTGRSCGDHGAVNVDLAVEVINKTGFVGLTDEWALSVCLWHKRFGGSMLPVELANERPGPVYKESFSKFVQYDDHRLLGNWRPVADNTVYAAAVRRFWGEIHQYGVDIEACEKDAWKSIDQSPIIDFPENYAGDEFANGSSVVSEGQLPVSRENESYVVSEEQPVSRENGSSVVSEEQPPVSGENGSSVVPEGQFPGSFADDMPKLVNIDPVYYLNVPKSGSSFATTIVHHVCGSDIPSDVLVEEPFEFARTYGTQCDLSRFGRFQDSTEPLGEEIVVNGLEHVVMVATDPAQRLLSSYYDDLHGCPDLYTQYNCTQSNETGAHKCDGDWTPEDGRFVRNPAVISPVAFGKCVANCTANLLTGQPCGRKGFPDVSNAVKHVDQLGFVGLMDEPRLSVCLWHKMFGGRVLPVELMNSATKRYDDDDLLGHWRPAADMRVFMAATRRFWRDIERFSVDRDACDLTFNAII